jgi:uncharacterized protein
VKFWDSSALVPLLVDEPSTGALASLYTRDPVIVTWWAAEVECASAVARLERDGDLTIADANEAFNRLARLSRSWHEIQPADEIRETAKRLLRVHNLRSADALQLAAAVVAAEHRPPTLELVCLDERLALAATKEGFRLVR